MRGEDVGRREQNGERSMPSSPPSAFPRRRINRVNENTKATHRIHLTEMYYYYYYYYYPSSLPPSRRYLSKGTVTPGFLPGEQPSSDPFTRSLSFAVHHQHHLVVALPSHSIYHFPECRCSLHAVLPVDPWISPNLPSRWIDTSQQQTIHENVHSSPSHSSLDTIRNTSLCLLPPLPGANLSINHRCISI